MDVHCISSACVKDVFGLMLLMESFAHRCIKNGANWTSELSREITQYLVRESIRPRRFVDVDLAQLTLDIIWIDNKVTGYSASIFCRLGICIHGTRSR